MMPPSLAAVPVAADHRPGKGVDDCGFDTLTDRASSSLTRVLIRFTANGWTTKPSSPMVLRQPVSQASMAFDAVCAFARDVEDAAFRWPAPASCAQGVTLVLVQRDECFQAVSHFP